MRERQEGKVNYTDEQLSVIQHTLDKHALVSAVAGSGKTQTLIGRIEYLLLNAVHAEQILVLMFNKSAVLSFKRRLKEALGESRANQIQVKTFHALGYQLTQYLQRQGLLSVNNFVGEGETLKAVVKEALAQTYRFLAIKEAITSEVENKYESYLALLKAELGALSSHHLLSQLDNETKKRVEIFFQFYERLRKSQGLQSFDDLIYDALKVFLDAPKKIPVKGKYQHIIVDECQDINLMQQRFLKIIAEKGAKVMAVGDVDQTIYEWRGSKTHYMLKEFARDFSTPEHYQLTYSFRYGHLVSLMANAVIQNNKSRFSQLCVSPVNSAPNTEVEIVSKKNLPLLIGALYKELEANVMMPEDVAVLVRKYSASVLLELYLLSEDLPYQLQGSGSVLDNKSISAIIGFLQLENDAKLLKEVDLNKRRLVVSAMLSVAKLYLNSSMFNVLLKEITLQPDKADKYLVELAKNANLATYQIERIETLAMLWRDALKKSADKMAYTFVKKVITELKLIPERRKNDRLLEGSESDIIEAFLNFCQLSNLTLAKFTSLFDKMRVNFDRFQSLDANKKISILSIHRAKGLQWRYVILYDMTEKSFFSEPKSQLKKEEIESERRLYYVAITRATRKLAIVAGNDMAKLKKWFSDRECSYPDALRKSNSIRFLYESQLTEIEAFLHAYSEKETEQMHKYAKYNKLIHSYWQKLDSQDKLSDREQRRKSA